MESRMSWTRIGLVLLAAMLCLVCAVSTSAQVQTSTSTTNFPAAKQVKILSGEVVAVKGNDLFVKMDDGSIRDFKVPAGATANVDGQQLGIADLKPGMRLTKATVTTTTPQMVTTIETVTGKVWHVTPPVAVILTLEDGQNQQFAIPEGQKFMVDGQETDAWGLKPGMKVTATKIVETPATSITKASAVVGTFPSDQPILIAKGAPKPAQAAATASTTSARTTAGTTSTAETTTTAANKLPKTAGDLPFTGLLGLIFGLGFACIEVAPEEAEIASPTTAPRVVRLGRDESRWLRSGSGVGAGIARTLMIVFMLPSRVTRAVR